MTRSSRRTNQKKGRRKKPQKKKRAKRIQQRLERLRSWLRFDSLPRATRTIAAHMTNTFCVGLTLAASPVGLPRACRGPQPPPGKQESGYAREGGSRSRQARRTPLHVTSTRTRESKLTSVASKTSDGLILQTRNPLRPGWNVFVCRQDLKKKKGAPKCDAVESRLLRRKGKQNRSLETVSQSCARHRWLATQFDGGYNAGVRFSLSRSVLMTAEEL